MKIELDLVYNNVATGESDTQTIAVDTDDEQLEFLATVCDARPTEETFDKFFRKMYDNPHKNGVGAGVLYEELWAIMSQWAFEKHGWSDVTVDVVGVHVDGEKLRISPVMMEITQWSLKLDRSGYMYCYE